MIRTNMIHTKMHARNFKLILLFSSLLILLAGCGSQNPYHWSNLSEDGIWKSYEDDKYTSRLGIDLSQWNDHLDWQTLTSECPVEFAILQIGYRGSSEGQLYSDPLFEEYWEGAHQEGLDVGVYFFSQAVTEDEAREEADFVLSILNGRSLELPVAYDLEVNSFSDATRIDGLSGKQMTENAIAFCDRIADAGYTPMIYTNEDWIRHRWGRKALEEYPIWFAQFNDKPGTQADFSIWQYGCEKLPGAKDTVDLNLQFLSR